MLRFYCFKIIVLVQKAELGLSKAYSYVILYLNVCMNYKKANLNAIMLAFGLLLFSPNSASRL